MTEWLEGADIDEAKQLAAERVVQQLELAPEREYTARMAVEAGRKAIAEVSSETFD